MLKNWKDLYIIYPGPCIQYWELILFFETYNTTALTNTYLSSTPTQCVHSVKVVSNNTTP